MAHRQLALFDPTAVTMSVVGLEFHRDLSEQECLQGAEQLGKIDRASRWVWGDLLNHVETHYSERYAAVAEYSELDYQSLANSKSVANSVEFYRRRENLSWSHHAEVAGLEPSEQDHWLDLAVQRGWTRRELRAWIRGEKKRKPLPTHTPLLRFCQDLPTPIIVSQILRVYFSDAETAYDMTGGDGGFWDGSETIDATRLIVDPSSHPGTDFFVDAEDDFYDVVLFDPSHIADAGDESIMGSRFGTYDGLDLEDAIRKGCREAWRIARLGVVVKVTDHIHAQQYVLESDWVREAIGGPPYDEVYQVRGNAVIDPKWEEQLSAYNNGSTFLIFRKDDQRHVRRSRAAR